MPRDGRTADLVTEASELLDSAERSSDEERLRALDELHQTLEQELEAEQTSAP